MYVRLSWLFVLSVLCVACQVNEPHTTPRHKSSLQHIDANPVSLHAESNAIPTFFSKYPTRFLLPPADFVTWQNLPYNQARVQSYQHYLTQAKLNQVVPLYQLMRNARDWKQCSTSPYSIPIPELWGNIVPTLHILEQLKQQQILTDFEVTSVYRDMNMNSCAGGALRSKHVYNSAIDFRIGAEDANAPEELNRIAESKRQLCHFWLTQGKALNMGLGIYASGQIHIDSQGFRTWGPDLTSNTSMCRDLF